MSSIAMDTRDWITIGIATITLLNGWGQFWVKERLFTKNTPANDAVLAMFKSRSGISFIAFTGFVSALSIWLLISEVISADPLTRFSCFLISFLTVLSVLNIVLISSLFSLRKISKLRKKLDEVELISHITLGRA